MGTQRELYATASHEVPFFAGIRLFIKRISENRSIPFPANGAWNIDRNKKGVAFMGIQTIYLGRVLAAGLLSRCFPCTSRCFSPASAPKGKASPGAGCG